MSRGLGPVQRRVLAILYEEAGKEGMSSTKLKVLLQKDQANSRRVFRGLMRRGLLEEVTVEGERCLRLTFWGALRAMPRLPKEPNPITKLPPEWGEKKRTLKEARAEERRGLEAEAVEGPRWVGYEHRPVRRRQPGPTQQLVLAILWEYPDSVDEGLPVSVVKSIMGSSDRSNGRRVLRTLLQYGEIEESEDGQRLRLSFNTALLFTIIPPIPPEPIGEERAREILRAHRGS